MINEKMLGLGNKRSVIREIFEYGNKRRSEIGAENVYDFSLGNPSIPAPEKVKETLISLIENTESTKLHGYTSAQGDLGVRTAICDNINERFNVGATPNLIYMTCGAAASLTISLNSGAPAASDESGKAPNKRINERADEISFFNLAKISAKKTMALINYNKKISLMNKNLNTNN